MGKVSNQTGKDGIGKPKRLEASFNCFISLLTEISSTHLPFH